MLDFSNRLFGCYFSQHCGLLNACAAYRSFGRMRFLCPLRISSVRPDVSRGNKGIVRPSVKREQYYTALFAVGGWTGRLRHDSQQEIQKNAQEAEMKGKETERSIMIPSGSQENHPSWSNSIICLAWTFTEGSSVSYRPIWVDASSVAFFRLPSFALTHRHTLTSRSRQLAIIQ